MLTEELPALRKISEYRHNASVYIRDMFERSYSSQEGLCNVCGKVDFAYTDDRTNITVCHGCYTDSCNGIRGQVNTSKPNVWCKYLHELTATAISEVAAATYYAPYTRMRAYVESRCECCLESMCHYYKSSIKITTLCAACMKKIDEQRCAINYKNTIICELLHESLDCDTVRLIISVCTHVYAGLSPRKTYAI